MRRVLRVAAFASLTAGGTVAAGWWTVPLLAAAWVQVLASDRRPVLSTMLGAALGWVALLGLGTRYGPVAAVAWCLSAALELPRWGFLAATIVFPVLLAGAAALLMKPASPR